MTGRGTTRGTATSKKVVIPTPQTGIPTTTRGSAPAATQTKCHAQGGRPATIETASLIPPSLHLEEPQAASLPTKPTKKSAANIIWEGHCTDQLVDWITSHISDHHILFHDHSASALTAQPPPGDKPSGKNKKDIASAIAKQIFGDDPDHATSYTSDPARYVTSVTNHLGT